MLAGGTDHDVSEDDELVDTPQRKYIAERETDEADPSTENAGEEDEEDGLSGEEDSDLSSETDEKEVDMPVLSRTEVTAIFFNILGDVDADKVILNTNADRATFLAKYPREILLARNTEGGSLLHSLTTNLKEDDEVMLNRRKPLVNLLLSLDERIPTWKDDRHETTLYVAVLKQLRKLVEYLCENSKPAVEALGIAKTNGDTCLHIAIGKELDIGFTKYLIDKMDKAMLLQKGERGNTPLHLAVEWERCKPGQVDLVKGLVELSPAALELKNSDNLSPFQYHMTTRRKSDPNKNSTMASDSVKQSKRSGFNENYPKAIEGSYNSRGRRSPERAKSRPDGRKRRNGAKVSIADAKQVESYLMLQCMHITDREKAIDALYGPIQKREIEFDLWERKIISDVDLQHMESYLKFEVILKYVLIPKLSVMRSQTINGDNRMVRKLPDCKGRLDYCLIFDWLRLCGVKKILRIIVHDNPTEPHSDEIIELALKQFGIEDWDWEKNDICSETILKAAPSVKVVHLYSSGNNAVLRGWSDKDGLAQLRKLETVYLIVNQGLDSQERTSINVSTFKERLRSLCPNVNIIARVEKAAGVIQDMLVSEKQIEQDKIRQKWLDCMESFGNFIVNYPVTPQEKIKVALIDDGVDPAFNDLGSNISEGLSLDKRATGLCSGYYQSSGGHGTIMACLIRLVCPKVQLYVVKLDEKLTAASAAKAVRWATHRGVHIISMSWTIQGTHKNVKDIEELEKAITSASRRNILMFCSASDLGNNAKKDQSQNYPYKCKPDKIFQIGAATASGKGWEWIGHGEVDYIFPGEKLLLQKRLGSDSLPESLSGSSLATALAAGLAALILYCTEVHSHQDMVLLRNHERMKEAFNAVGVSDKYVLVWETFEISHEEMRCSEEKILENIVKKLLNDSVFRLRRERTVEFK